MATLYGGTNPCSDSPARQPEVNGWIESLGYAAERLMGQAVELQKRLDPILAADAPNDGSAKEQQAGCQVAAAIQSKVITLNNAEAILASILRRLEI